MKGLGGGLVITVQHTALAANAAAPHFWPCGSLPEGRCRREEDRGVASHFVVFGAHGTDAALEHAHVSHGVLGRTSG